MNELERTKRALEYATSELIRMHKVSGERVKSDVDKILNPPPEMEEVEISRYYVPSQPGDRAIFEDAGLAKRCCISGEEPVHLVGHYQRPKPQPVERSVKVTLEAVSSIGVAATFDSISARSAATGKTGRFVWTG